MGKFKTKQMKDKKKAQKLGLAAPPASRVAPPAGGLEHSRLVEEDELDFGDIPVEERPADWEEQLRASGVGEDWIDAYRPPAPEVPTPPEGMERVVPWKCHLCNRFRLEFQTGDDAREDMENAADAFNSEVQEDEISAFVFGRSGEKWRAAYCHWCDTPVNVVVTGPYRGAQE